LTTATVPNVAEAIETVESHLHPTPSWSIADHPMPTGREEIWRFTPVKRFRKLLDETATGATPNWAEALPEGVTVRQLSVDEARELSVEAPVDRIAALAHDLSGGAQLIEVPDDFVAHEPITLTLEADGGNLYGHTIIRIGRHAQLTLVIVHRGTASYAEKTDIRVGDGAQLNLVTLQDWESDAVHGGQRSLSIGRDAQVKAITASMGGVIRLQENARYEGPGGDLHAYGLYFVDGGQHVQHRLFVDHNQPNTASNVDYRGALQGEGAHSVWIGDVLIRKVALGIETYEANKNLVLTDGCQADSVPNLEIETGEIVGAGHSSTTGRFDDTQLFYLMSRGVPEEEARRLIVHGFFNDIIRRIGVDSIEEKLLAQVERELELVHGTTRTAVEA